MNVEQALGQGISVGRTEPTIAELDNVFPDSTLVLVAGGSVQRDPNDPLDLYTAVVDSDEQTRQHGPKGPAWNAKDLYTSTLFQAKQEFAMAVSQWAQKASGWAILSPEHGVVEPWRTVCPYETTVDDLGGDETNPDHRVSNEFLRRRPDGREIVTELDRWAAKVSRGLMRWVASHRDDGDIPGNSRANTLLVVAEKKYITPLRERGVFEYGISRMAGNPNTGFKQPLTPTYLFETIDADTKSERIAWLSDALSRFSNTPDAGTQIEASRWTGRERECNQCGEDSPESSLKEVDGEVTCLSCRPKPCARCEQMTHSCGMGNYPLCPECQTKYGGQKRTPHDPEETEQTELPTATQGQTEQK